MPRKPLFLLFCLPWMRWLAVLIAVFGALAATPSHALALARSSGPAWAEVCTSTGAHWMMPDKTANAAPRITGIDASADTRSGIAATPVSTDFTDEHKSLPPLLHCPLCLLLADHAAPASPFSSPFFVAPETLDKPAVRPVLFFFTRFAFGPPPRGPPEFS